jgi:hypothetical protein
MTQHFGKNSYRTRGGRRRLFPKGLGKKILVGASPKTAYLLKPRPRLSASRIRLFATPSGRWRPLSASPSCRARKGQKQMGA